MTAQEPEVTSNQSEEEIPLISPRLKALVLWQGVAIIIGILVIFGTLAYRAVNMISDAPKQTSEMTHRTVGTPASVMPNVGSIQAPIGSSLYKVHTGEVFVTLEFHHENGKTTLVFIDINSGREQGRLLVETP